MVARLTGNRSSISGNGNGQTIRGLWNRDVRFRFELQASERDMKPEYRGDRSRGKGGRGIAVVSRRVVEFK